MGLKEDIERAQVRAREEAVMKHLKRIGLAPDGMPVSTEDALRERVRELLSWGERRYGKLSPDAQTILEKLALVLRG